MNGLSIEPVPALVQRAQAGDLDAFGALVLRFQDMAHAHAYAVLGDAHLAQDAAQEARDLFARYAALHAVVEVQGVDALEGDDRIVALRARRVQRFLTQPFVVAEPWTGQPGEQVPLPDTIAGVRAILAGRYDAVPEEALHFIGKIEQIAA